MIDQAVLAKSRKMLHAIIQTLNYTGKLFDFETNVEKTTTYFKLEIDGQKIEQV